jgi:hypothetical protein
MSAFISSLVYNEVRRSPSDGAEFGFNISLIIGVSFLFHSSSCIMMWTFSIYFIYFV